jgi:hypothetical protein
VLLLVEVGLHFASDCLKDTGQISIRSRQTSVLAYLISL